MNPIRQNGLFALVKFQNLKFNFLVDTGAAISCIDKSKFDKLGFKESDLEDISTTLTAASGNDLKVYGKINLNFLIDNISMSQDFIVADLDEIEGILGIDMLEISQAQIDIAKSSLIMPDNIVIKLSKQSNKHCALIRIKEKLVLPASSESVIQVKIPKNVKNGDMLVEPNMRLAKSGILVSSALVNTKDRQITVTAINCRDLDIPLKKNKVIGSIQSIKTISDPSELHKEDNTCQLPDHLQCLIDNVSPKISDEQKLSS